jgi:hypothetical protein
VKYYYIIQKFHQKRGLLGDFYILVDLLERINYFDLKIGEKLSNIFYWSFGYFNCFDDSEK